jgi:D-sedoheptulose 7-phosphate isomerase
MNDSELMALYPFLHGQAQDSAQLDAALLESVGSKARESRETSERFFAECARDLVLAARAIAGVYRHGGRLFAMGNGGSSCDAAQVAVAFLHPVTAGRPALPAVNLAADQAMMSAVASDIGFEHVFSRQILALGRPGDGLVGISTSGSSSSILAGFARARELGMVTVALTGGDGGRLALSGAVDHCLVVPSESIHRIQECHAAAYHILWDLVHTLLADDRGAARARDAEP